MKDSDLTISNSLIHISNGNEGVMPKRVKIGPKTGDYMFTRYATNTKASNLWFISPTSDRQVKGLTTFKRTKLECT